MAKQNVTFEQIIGDLRNKKYAPVYLFMGEESYYIDILSDYIQNNVLTEIEKEFNLTILYGKDTDMTTVINAAKRYPMMGEHQVVIVKEAQNIKDWENLSFYIQKPLHSTILVFCYKNGVPDKRKKWLQDISKSGLIFESTKLRDYEIASWIKKYAQSKKVDVEEKAVVMLSENLGTDLSKIVNEIEKLIITLPEGSRRITPHQIETNIGISKDFNVFELQNSLINRDILKANRIVRYFADNRKANPMVMVLPQLFNFFSNLMIYHYLADKTPGNVAAELRINPYFTKDYQKAAQTFGAWKTMNIITYIRETDARGKGIDSNGISEEDLYKELIFKILH